MTKSTTAKGVKSDATDRAMDSTTICIGKYSLPARNLINSLSVLLLVQLALAVVLFTISQSSYQPVEPTAPLLTCDFSKIGKVVLEERESDGKKSTAVLQKRQPGWQLPDYFGAPAAAQSIDQLFKSLKDLKKGFPVTTTAGAADRFKVSADNFAHAISLYGDNQMVTTLYLGSSPNFKAVYAKLPNANDIYTVELPQYQVSAKPNDWLDKSLADLKSDEITAVDMGTFNIQKNDGKWTLSSENDKHPLSESVVHSLIDPVSHISVNSILGTKPDSDYNSDHPVLSYKVTLKDGTALTYTFSRSTGKNMPVLKISNKDWYLAVDDWSVNRIKAITAESLLKREDEAAKRAEAGKRNQPNPQELKQQTQDSKEIKQI